MDSANSRTAQASTRDPAPKQLSKLVIKAIHVRVLSKSFSLKSTIDVTMDDHAQSKKFFLRNTDKLQWNLKTPLHIVNGAELSISWKATGKSGCAISMTLPYQSIHDQIHDSELEYVHANGSIRVVFDKEFQPEDFYEAAELIKEHKTVLEQLGKSAGIVKKLLAAGDIVKDLHPAAGAILSSLTMILNILKQQDTEHKDILSLLTQMANIIDYTFYMEGYATFAPLMEVIQGLKKTMDDTAKLVIERSQRGNSKAVLSLLVSDDRDRIKKIKEIFSQLRGDFDRGVNMERFKQAQEDRLLAKLDINHQPPALRCLPGTREDILAEIIAWADDFNAPNIMWIHAYPGAGKSTLASTVALDFKEAGRLGALFAFDRKAVTSTSALWCTVSYKLAVRCPVCRDHIVTKIKSGAMDNATADDIFNELVVEPLNQYATSMSNGLPVFIIDALDECGVLDSSAYSQRTDLLSTIGKWVGLHKKFKLLVTSRAEVDITTKLSKISHILALESGDRTTSNTKDDIIKYFEHEFAEITVGKSNLHNWPGRRAIAELAEQASGIFIWARTVMKYI
ncbi:hypothetical protein FA95DRAFT_1523392, partial [Auriscalpium vulgare]